MNYEQSIREAAHRADGAVSETMAAYRDGTATEKPAITGALVMALRNALNGYRERGQTENFFGRLIF
jgi:hypothetical protein